MNGALNLLVNLAVALIGAVVVVTGYWLVEKCMKRLFSCG